VTSISADTHKPTTIRIPDDLLKEIDHLVQELKLDRSAYLREIVSKGFSIDREDRLLRKYVKGELNYMEVYRELGQNPWELLDHLEARNPRTRNVSENSCSSGNKDRTLGTNFW
jgi:predicted DNA-binding protein